MILDIFLSITEYRRTTIEAGSLVSSFVQPENGGLRRCAYSEERSQ